MLPAPAGVSRPSLSLALPLLCLRADPCSPPLCLRAADVPRVRMHPAPCSACEATFALPRSASESPDVPPARRACAPSPGRHDHEAAGAGSAARCRREFRVGSRAGRLVHPPGRVYGPRRSSTGGPQTFWRVVDTFSERCRSGRTGRSRKPLGAQASPGFESLPLRHSATEKRLFATPVRRKQQRKPRLWPRELWTARRRSRAHLSPVRPFLSRAVDGGDEGTRP